MPVQEKRAKRENSDDWNDSWTGDDDEFELDDGNFKNPIPITPPKQQILAQIEPKPQPAPKQEPRIVFQSPNPPAKPQVDAKVEEVKIVEEASHAAPKDTKTQSDPPKTKPQAALEKCTTNNDCQEDQFCIVKVGKCVKKFELGADGCTKHAECLGSGVACVSQGKLKRCLMACKVNDSDNVCGQNAHCSIDKAAVKGLKGGFEGVCKSGKASISSKELVSKAVSQGSFSGLFVPLTISIGLFIGAVVGFLWIRSWLKKKNVNNDPKSFLFTPSKSNLPDERLDNKLFKMPGTRYTVWAPLE